MPCFFISKPLKDILQHFKLVNWRIRGFVFLMPQTGYVPLSFENLFLCHRAYVFLLNTSQICFKNLLHCKKKLWSNYFNYLLFIFSEFGPAKQKLQKMESLKQLFACGICKKSFNLAISLSEHVELHRSRKEPKNAQKIPRNQGNLSKGIDI